MNVIIVDDHPLIRSGIRSSIILEENVNCVEEAANIDEALTKIKTQHFDLSIIDIYLEQENGFDLVKEMKKKNIKTKILILTSSIKKSDFYRAKELHVDGYMLKQAYIEDIIYAINVIDRGKIFYDSNVMEFSDEASLESLTTRENEVLIEIKKGLSNLDIANNLYISEHTVKKHISSILAKLELTNRTELALYAMNIMEFHDNQ